MCVACLSEFWLMGGQRTTSPSSVGFRYQTQVVRCVQLRLLPPKLPCWPHFQVYLIIFATDGSYKSFKISWYTNWTLSIWKKRERYVYSSINCCRKLKKHRSLCCEPACYSSQIQPCIWECHRDESHSWE